MISNILFLIIFIILGKVTHIFNRTWRHTPLNFKIHSNYFPNTYMPLSSIFYNQNETELGWVPYFSSSIYLEKTNFSLGLIFREIQYAFLERNYLTKDYIANPSMKTQHSLDMLIGF